MTWEEAYKIWSAPRTLPSDDIDKPEEPHPGFDRAERIAFRAGFLAALDQGGTEMDTSRDGTAAYWRNAYEALVKQTGRDLNDGLGVDPRRRAALGQRG